MVTPRVRRTSFFLHPAHLLSTDMLCSSSVSHLLQKLGPPNTPPGQTTDPMPLRQSSLPRARCTKFPTGRCQLKCDGTLAQTSFRLSSERMSPFISFPLHFPYRASPCAITFQLESTNTSTQAVNACLCTIHKSNLQYCAESQQQYVP